MNVDRLIAEEESGWARLTDAFAAIPVDRLGEPSVTPDGWSPKDVMFHVGYWMHDCAGVLERIAAGTWDGAGDETPAAIEATNREGFERSRGMGLDEVRAGFEDGHRRMHAAFGALEEVTPGAWEWFEESGPLHYAKHVADLSGLGR